MLTAFAFPLNSLSGQMKSFSANACNSRYSLRSDRPPISVRLCDHSSVLDVSFKFDKLIHLCWGETNSSKCGWNHIKKTTHFKEQKGVYSPTNVLPQTCLNNLLSQKNCFGCVSNCEELSVLTDELVTVFYALTMVLSQICLSEPRPSQNEKD